ncbi:MAG: hypothetical protein HY335_05940 [Deinococcus sp.]|nr:hypothetical protein [Deinococcus sp.]
MDEAGLKAKLQQARDEGYRAGYATGLTEGRKAKANSQQDYAQGYGDGVVSGRFTMCRDLCIQLSGDHDPTGDITPGEVAALGELLAAAGLYPGIEEALTKALHTLDVCGLELVHLDRTEIASRTGLSEPAAQLVQLAVQFARHLTTRWIAVKR